jgi:glycosyltransferase involved in cell wall biosynthesis
MISVIIPTYRPQAYIWECLLSLTTQTLPKNLYEIIIVLNGCNEPFHSQIQQYIIDHLPAHQVQLIQTNTGGVSNARNIGLNVAKGEYISFIDDDDYVSPGYLEELYTLADKNTIVLAYPYAFNDGKPNIQLPYRITNAYDYCIKYNCQTIVSKARKFFSGPCMKLLPVNFIQDRRFDTRFKNGEDSLFMFSISDKINKLSFTSREAIYYRRYRENSAVTQQRSLAQRFTNAMRMIREYIKIYVNSSHTYSFRFFITRILGTLKSIFFLV